MRAVALEGATIVLTGASSGIGRATARLLAPLAGHLILHGLEPAKDVDDLLAEIRSARRPGSEVDYLRADFGSLADVARLAQDIRAATPRIDVLVNNAARPGPTRRTVTGDGNEATLQTNYLAPVLLTESLLDIIGGDVRGRIVNVASATHLSARLFLDDLDLARHGYSDATAYAHSKLALVTWSCWLAAHRPRPSLDVVSMHPGIIATTLLHAMFSIGGDRPEHAARNVLAVAGQHGDNGAYYDERERAEPNAEALDPAMQDRLRDLTMTRLAAWLPGKRVAGR
ncbi:MAG: SDR family NAD(P)-dependent oxidoreductase [Bauldia sp.]